MHLFAQLAAAYTQLLLAALLCIRGKGRVLRTDVLVSFGSFPQPWKQLGGSIKSTQQLSIPVINLILNMRKPSLCKAQRGAIAVAGTNNRRVSAHCCLKAGISLRESTSACCLQNSVWASLKLMVCICAAAVLLYFYLTHLRIGCN